MEVASGGGGFRAVRNVRGGRTTFTTPQAGLIGGRMGREEKDVGCAEGDAVRASLGG